MISLKTKELIEFFKKTAAIKSNSILPVLDFVKLQVKDDKAFLTKSNMEIFCCHQLEATAKGEHEVLINETILKTLLQTGAETVDVFYYLSKKKDEPPRVKLVSGNSKVEFQSYDASHFPKYETHPKDEVVSIGQEVIEAISIAGRYVKNDDTSNPNLTVVHVLPGSDGKSCVYAYNGPVCFRKKLDCLLPKLWLHADACKILSNYLTVNYWRNGNMDFFDTGITLYGFIQTEYKPGNFEILLQRFANENTFSLEKQHIERFCDLVNACTVHPSPFIKLSKNEKGVCLLYNDDGVETDSVLNVPADVDVTDYVFNSKLLGPSLKSFPYSNIQLTTAITGILQVYAPDDKDVLMVVMGIAQN